MYRFLTRVYDASLLDFYIPHRYREGYGVSKAGIDFAYQNNFTLSSLSIVELNLLS